MRLRSARVALLTVMAVIGGFGLIPARAAETTTDKPTVQIPEDKALVYFVRPKRPGSRRPSPTRRSQAQQRCGCAWPRRASDSRPPGGRGSASSSWSGFRNVPLRCESDSIAGQPPPVEIEARKITRAPEGWLFAFDWWQVGRFLPLTTEHSRIALELDGVFEDGTQFVVEVPIDLNVPLKPTRDGSGSKTEGD